MFVWPQRSVRRYHGIEPLELSLSEPDDALDELAVSSVKSVAARMAVAAADFLRKTRRFSRAGDVMRAAYFRLSGKRQKELDGIPVK